MAVIQDGLGNNKIPIIKETTGRASPINGLVSKELTGSDRGSQYNDILANFRNNYNITALSAERIKPGEVGFFIVYDNLSLLLPINPADVSFHYPGNNETRTIITSGDINLIKSPGLVEVTIDSFFPRNINNVSQVNTTNQFLPSTYYQELLDALYHQKEYFRLVITGYNFSELVAIENLTWNYEYGDFENLYYTLELKGYRPYGITLTYDGSTANQDDTPTDVYNGTYRDNSSTEATNPSDTTAKEIVVGSKVKCTGQLFVDSFGSKGGVTFNNKSGTVTLIAKGNSHPYHFVAGDSTGSGWVLESSLTLE